jgi:hypothetical protein
VTGRTRQRADDSMVARGTKTKKGEKSEGAQLVKRGRCRFESSVAVGTLDIPFFSLGLFGPSPISRLCFRRDLTDAIPAVAVASSDGLTVRERSGRGGVGFALIRRTSGRYSMVVVVKGLGERPR